MKIKKIVLLFSLISVLFSLTACDDGQGEVTFEYDDTSVIYSSIMLAYNFNNMDDATRAYINVEGEDAYRTGLSNFDTAQEECGDFEGYVSKEDGSAIMIDLASVDTSTEEGTTELLTFLSLVDATVEENGDTVVATLKAVHEDRNVDYTFIYVEDPTYAYGGSSTTYKPNEITVSPAYTFGEIMGKAGMNTLMGMGTVFIVLIFISFIIGQFEKLDKLITKVTNAIANWIARIKEKKANKASKKEATEEATKAPEAPAAPVTTEVNPMDDAQLVAVITAAIMASNGGATGTDKLIVRSIRKAKR